MGIRSRIFDSTGISLQELVVSNALVIKSEEMNIGELEFKYRI